MISYGQFNHLATLTHSTHKMNDTKSPNNTTGLKKDTRTDTQLVNDENHDNHNTEVRPKRQTGRGINSLTKTNSAKTPNTRLKRVEHKKHNSPVTQTHIDASWAAHPGVCEPANDDCGTQKDKEEDHDEPSFRSIDSREISREYHRIKEELSGSDSDSDSDSDSKIFASNKDWIKAFFGDESVSTDKDVSFISEGISRVELDEK